MSIWKKLFGGSSQAATPPSPSATQPARPTPPPTPSPNIMAEVEKANQILAMSGERIEVPSGSSDKDTLLLILSAYKRVLKRDVSPHDSLAIRRAQLQTDKVNAHLMLLMTKLRNL